MSCPLICLFHLYLRHNSRVHAVTPSQPHSPSSSGSPKCVQKHRSCPLYSPPLAEALTSWHDWIYAPKKKKERKKETWNGSFFPPGLNGHFRVETLSCRYCSFGSTEQTAKHSGIIKPFPRWHSGKHWACCTERENGGKSYKTCAVTQTHSKKRKSPILTHNLWSCFHVVFFCSYTGTNVFWHSKISHNSRVIQ